MSSEHSSRSFKKRKLGNTEDGGPDLSHLSQPSAVREMMLKKHLEGPNAHQPFIWIPPKEWGKSAPADEKLQSAKLKYEEAKKNTDSMMERLSTDEGYKELKKAAVNLLHTYNGYTAAINHLQNQQSHVAGINKEMIKCEDIQAAETLIIALGLKNVLDAIQKE